MKNKKMIICFVMALIIMVIFLIIGFTNKTFLKTYYEVNNLEGNKLKVPLPLFSYYKNESNEFVATFSTLRSAKNVQNILNEYVENLQACYDESYFYDADLGITIKRYYIEKGFPFNKIYLTYDQGNYCENEFVLADGWMTEFTEKAEIQEIKLNKCVIENESVECISKTINKTDIEDLFEYISKEKVKRVENKNNIGLDESSNHYELSIYYVMEGKGYMLSIFTYDNYLAFKVIDSDDHQQNAIYNIGEDANQLLVNIYNKH